MVCRGAYALLGKEYEAMKRKRGRPISEKGPETGPFNVSGKTYDKLAKEHGVGKNKVIKSG